VGTRTLAGMISSYIPHYVTYAPALTQRKYSKKYDA
jgi:hypothetical protein